MKEIVIGVVILDYIFGDPHWIPHPIAIIGRIIKGYEILIRKSSIPLRLGGFLLAIGTILTVISLINLILYIAVTIHPVLHLMTTIYFLYTSLAAKCLHIESNKVYNSLKYENIKEARRQLSYLVGRDTSQLSEKEIIRGAVETVSENTIDGVLAPTIYMLVGFLFGMPVQLVFLYKTINTLDSMVGYTNEYYRDIGYSSAKLDDFTNYIPARLGSILMLIAGGLLGYDLKNGFKILMRDRRNHKSPNCGYPESAVAGLLNIEIGGANIYFGEKIYKPTIGDKNKELELRHIKDAIKIMYCSQLILLTISIIFF